MPSGAPALPHGCTPGHAALLELGDDLVGDFLIQAVAVGEGFVDWGRARDGRSLRRAGESFLSPDAPVTRPAPAFSSPLPAIPSCTAVANKAEACPTVTASAAVTRQGGDGSPARGKSEPAPSPRSGDRTRPDPRRMPEEGDAQNVMLVMVESFIRQKQGPVLMRRL